jgi:hypothetical protein
MPPAFVLPRPDLRVLLVMLALLTVLAYNPAWANGRATLIASQEAGPYRIDVSLLPSQAVVANTHISILLNSISNDRVITDATVNIWGTGPEEGTDFGPIPAINSTAPQFFEADLPFDIDGPWEVTITVSSELGEETIVLTMDVLEGGGLINWILMVAIAVAVLTVGIWTWDRITGGKKSAEPSQEET